MLHKDPIFDSKNVRCDPAHGQAEVRKSSMHDYEISIGHDRSRLVLERWRKALDEFEQPLATRCDMGAVLDVVGRPKLLSSRVVPLIEERIESFQDECF